MVDIIKIEEGQYRELKRWATETTLEELLSATQKSNELLKAIGGRRTGGVDLERAARSAQEGLSVLGKGTHETRKGMGGFKKALKDLEDSQWKYSSATKGLIDKFLTAGKDPTRLIPEMLQQSTSGVAGFFSKIAGIFGKKGKAVGVGITALGAVLGAGASKIAERVLETSDAYRSMIQSGITFGGSIDQMVASVRGAGVSFEAANKIIEQQGSMLVAVGEKNFFAAADKMGSTFKRLGMTGDQGTEMLAELMDQMRTTGAVYTMSEEQRKDANEATIRQLQQQQVLTGKSIKQQLTERKALAERASFLALVAGKEGPERQRLLDWSKQLANVMSPDQAMGIIMASEGIGGTKGYGQAQMGMGDVAQQLANQIASGVASADATPILLEAGAKMEAFVAQNSKLAAISLEKGINNLFTDTISAALPHIKTYRDMMTSLADPQKAAQAENAAKGMDILGTKTQKMYDTLFDITKGFAQFEAVAWEKISSGLDGVLEKFKKAAEVLKKESMTDIVSEIGEKASTGVQSAMDKVSGAMEGAGALAMGGAGWLATKGAAVAEGMGGTAARAAPGLLKAGGSLIKGAGIGTAASLADLGLEYLTPEFYKSMYGNIVRNALTGAGAGATGGAFFGGIGAGPGAIAGGIGGAGYGTYQALYGNAADAREAAIVKNQAAVTQAVRTDRQALVAPDIPAQGTLNREQIAALEEYTTKLTQLYEQLTRQGLDQRNQELRDILEKIANNTSRVEDAVKAIDR